jgi:ketosteroid isomerase-like protein
MRTPVPLDGASYDDVRVRLFGPVAVLHAVLEALYRDGKVAKVRYTDVYVWNGAAWRRVSNQNTLIRDGVVARQQTAASPAHAPWQGQDPSGDDLDVLRILNENYVKAFREADVAWYDAHLAPEYVVASGDGSFHDRAAALANFARPSFATHMKSFPVDKVNIRRFDDVALIHAENDYELKDGRKGVSRYTDIWHRQNGRWRCIAAHITVHKAPAP